MAVSYRIINYIYISLLIWRFKVFSNEQLKKILHKQLIINGTYHQDNVSIARAMVSINRTIYEELGL